MGALDEAIAAGVVTDVPERGLPREVADGLPVPFAVRRSDQGDVAWASIDSKLTLLCTLDQRCHVCGDELADDEAWAFHDFMGRVVDGWVMHQRCARMARAHCPHLRAELGDTLFVHQADPGIAAALRDEQLRKLGER